jgi:hypothetical protein
MLPSFNPKYMLFWRVRNIFNRAVPVCSYSRAALLALKTYAVSFRVVLQCRESLWNWIFLTEFDCCGSLDTVVSMGMKRLTHLQERGQVLL